MGFVLAITGKGGTGKTTLASLVVSRLVARGQTPVLAVDADPNTSLDQALGVQVRTSVGTVREETKAFARAEQSLAMSKRQWLELKVTESLVESDGFDLISLGRPEGPGCYCYANNVLRDVIQHLARQYPYLIIDNEAGLENLSRRLVAQSDCLMMVGDPSRRGLETIRRLFGLAGEMGIEYRKAVVVLNRVRGQEAGRAAERLAAEARAADLLLLPEDPDIATANEQGVSVSTLAVDNPVVAAVDAFVSSNLGKGSS